MCARRKYAAYSHEINRRRRRLRWLLEIVTSTEVVRVVSIAKEDVGGSIVQNELWILHLDIVVDGLEGATHRAART